MVNLAQAMEAVEEGKVRSIQVLSMLLSNRTNFFPFFADGFEFFVTGSVLMVVDQIA